MTIPTYHYCLLVALSSCAAAVPGSSEKLNGASTTKAVPVWCLTEQPAAEEPNDWLDLPQKSIHVVRADMQVKAKAALANRSFAELNAKNVRSYLRGGETVSSGKHYLVRAGAFGVNNKYDAPKAAF